MSILWIILAILTLGGALFFMPLRLAAGVFWFLIITIVVLLISLLVKLIIFLAPILFILGIVLIIWGLIEGSPRRMHFREHIEEMVNRLIGRGKPYTKDSEQERLEILEKLEDGEISYEEAMERLKRIRR
jgi:membrane protein implicated in regulation of membrane protease activity